MAAVFHVDCFMPTCGDVEMGFLLKKPMNRAILLIYFVKCRFFYNSLRQDNGAS